jgi:hypothetical protein
MLPKKVRVPAVIVVVTVATLAAATSCGRQVCKQGDPSCGTAGAGGTSDVSSTDVA